MHDGLTHNMFSYTQLFTPSPSVCLFVSCLSLFPRGGLDVGVDVDVDFPASCPPESESDAEGGYRRGSGGLVVRTHNNVAPLTAALGVENIGAAVKADAATDGSRAGGEASLGRRGSGSGGLVVRSHRNIAPLSTQVIACVPYKVYPSLRSLQAHGSCEALLVHMSSAVCLPTGL